MHTLHSDVYQTRRKALHHIADDAGDLVWSGSRLEDALNYLVENEQTKVRVIGATYAFTLEVRSLPQ